MASPGNGAAIAALPRPAYDPIPLFVGPNPGYQGPVAGPRPVNTPIGAIAYTAPQKVVTPAPLKPDPSALSMARGQPAKQKAEAKRPVVHDHGKAGKAKEKSLKKTKAGGKQQHKAVEK